MRIALIYTGHLRTWEVQCRQNHLENLWTDETHPFFYTYEEPGGVNITWNKIQEQFFPDPWGKHRYSSRMRKENTVFQSFNQWHNNMVGFCLVPTDYDIYVRVRPDIIFDARVNFGNCDCSGRNIYIPNGHDYGGITDQFAIGNREVMKIYYSVYFNVHELWHNGAEFHSEGMQLANLQSNNVNIIRQGPMVHIKR